MTTTRRPAITRTVTHPADTIPDRSEVIPTPASDTDAPTPTQQQPAHSSHTRERLTEQHNVRIRASVKERLGRAVDKMRYETGDRSISIASITDTALDDYLTRHNC